MHEKRLHIAYHPIYAHPLPEDHRFPMSKYELIPAQLLYEGTIMHRKIFSARAPAPMKSFCGLIQQATSEN
jgi:hypothetical protein